MGWFRQGAPVTPGREQIAGSLAVTLLTVEDPYETPIVNGHTTEEDKLGLARLIAFEVSLRNGSQTETVSVSSGKFHLFDDLHFVHESFGLDSRCRDPRLQEAYLVPGSTMRGWLTYRLGWDRQPARLQFFTGYLGGKVAVFPLPTVDAATLAANATAARERRAGGEVGALLSAREREVAALEARASVSTALVEQEERIRELEARAERARATIAQADRARAMLARLEDPD